MGLSGEIEIISLNNMKTWLKVTAHISIIRVNNNKLTFVNLIRKIRNVWTCGYRYITWLPIDESFICKDGTEACKMTHYGCS